MSVSENASANVNTSTSANPLKYCASSLPELLSAVSQVYRGPSQYTALKSILVGMITGQPVLLIGPHGTFKSSMASFMGRMFERCVVVLTEDARSFGEIERFFTSLGKELGEDPEVLMQNRADGVDVVYTDYPGFVRIRAVVDLAKHPMNADAVREPIRVFSRQLNEQMEPEDLLGYAVHHRVILGEKPPHVVKEGRLAGADYVILDEAFAAPRLMSKLHTAINEKVVETSIGPVRISPLTFIFCTNPWNQFYQTNPKVVNAATLDRFLLSAPVEPPSSAEILYTVGVLRSLKIKERLDVTVLYAAREEVERAEKRIPPEITRFCVALVAALGTCYFSPAGGAPPEGKLPEKPPLPASPFMIERDCGLCRYRNSICALASIGKVRAVLYLNRAVAASAVLRGAKDPSFADLEFALTTVLPHRLHFNDRDFLLSAGTMHSATVKLINRYAEDMSSYQDVLRKIMALNRNNTWAEIRSLWEECRDVPPLRALIDDVVLMMKEAAEKKGEKGKEEIPDEFVERVSDKCARLFAVHDQQGQKQ